MAIFSCEVPLLIVATDIADASLAQVRMLSTFTDVFTSMPATFTLGSFTGLHLNSQT